MATLSNLTRRAAGEFHSIVSFLVDGTYNLETPPFENTEKWNKVRNLCKDTYKAWSDKKDMANLADLDSSMVGATIDTNG